MVAAIVTRGVRNRLPISWISEVACGDGFDVVAML